MNLSKIKISNRALYWALVLTFTLLYIFVAFVSTLHAIDFFKLANSTVLAILLGIAYEVGQASVLFSILMTTNKDKFLPWALMILLTSLQITANVYASFKHMMQTGSNDWQYWQKSILFGVQASSPEMYQVIISWISGALLPVIALGMTALVAEMIRTSNKKDEEDEAAKAIIPADQADEIITNEVEKRVAQQFSEDMKHKNMAYIENSEVADVERLKGKYSQLVADSFEKELIIPDELKKKGRPPKEEDEKVAELKKEQEPLPAEEVKVPEKPKRFVNPLKLKSKKIKPAKNLKEFHQESTGDKIIQIIENIDKEKDKESIIIDASLNLDVSEPIQTIEEPHYGSYIVNGVEVVDVKAIPKPDEKKK